LKFKNISVFHYYRLKISPVRNEFFLKIFSGEVYPVSTPLYIRINVRVRVRFLMFIIVFRF